MPLAKLCNILSCSSEDEKNKAINLSENNPALKWSTGKPGEGQAVVIFQLEKAVEINSIDIGNNGSAFVEVFGGKSSQTDCKYEILLVASSFMSPAESRQNLNINKVRIFEKSKCVSENICQSWDRIKIVCTQPFNKRNTYGLSFVNIHTVEDKKTNIKKDVIEEKVSTKIKAEVQNRPIPKLTNSKQSDTSEYMKIYKIIKKTAKNEDLEISKSEITLCKNMDDANTLLDSKRKNKQNKEKLKSQNTDEPPSKKIKQDTTQKIFSPTPQKIKHERTQKVSTNTPIPKKGKKKSKKNVPYCEIMKGVVFALSGYQNPLRGKIRDEALAMGAEYARDWSHNCTHLICAFANTPKFKAVVSQGGNVVGDGWIKQCAKKKKMVNWRRFNMNPNDSPINYSSSEDEEITEQPGTSKSPQDVYEQSTDEENTDDEIERLQAAGKLTKEEVDPYDVSTDEENSTNNIITNNGKSNSELDPLPNHFENSIFFVYKIKTQERERLIRRHIISCGGEVKDYMSDEVEYIITDEDWDKTFDDQVSINTDIKFVKPLWIFQCSQNLSKLPYHPFEICA